MQDFSRVAFKAARRYSKFERPETPFPAILYGFCLFNWQKTPRIIQQKHQLLTTCVIVCESEAEFTEDIADNKTGLPLPCTYLLPLWQSWRNPNTPTTKSEELDWLDNRTHDRPPQAPYRI